MCLVVRVIVALFAMSLVQAVQGLELDNRWTVTATPGTGNTQGSPAIVTWSLVPDGTAIPGKPWLRETESSDPSNLIAFLDGLYGDGGGVPYSQRPWFFLFSSAADRWSDLSGLSFVYESNDDGERLYLTLFNTTIDGARGQLGVRGDVRIGGHYIDGQAGSNTLAYNSYPNAGEMVIDTANTAFFGNPANNYRAARNVIMHELGHAMGIRHAESSNSAFLMEPNISSAFDGPQFDDILAAHRWYGDVYEKSNGLAGNDVPANATWLGAFSQTGQLAIGTDAADMFVAPHEVDFVSIDDDSDIDFYRFSVPHAGKISALLIPRGPTYLEGPEGQAQTSFQSNAQSDLSLRLLTSDGLVTLGMANNTGFGGVESLTDISVSGPGEYLVEITGSQNAAQMYELQVSYVPSLFLPGDVNLDGFLDFGSGNPETDDLLAFIRGWKTVVSTDDDITAWRKGDLNLDGVSDLKDAFLLRKVLTVHQMDHLVALLQGSEPTQIPEPQVSLVGLLVAPACYRAVRRSHVS
jgi:hypothetical protein